MNLTEKVAYIKGLIEGMKLDESKDEIKALQVVIDLLEDLSFTVVDLEERADETDKLMDVLDEDLSELEESVYGEDYCDCDECDCDEDLYEIVCPTCGETVVVSEEVFEDGSMKCPNCNEELDFDFSDLEKDDED